jgi:hypothetical protein
MQDHAAHDPVRGIFEVFLSLHWMLKLTERLETTFEGRKGMLNANANLTQRLVSRYNKKQYTYGREIMIKFFLYPA